MDSLLLSYPLEGLWPGRKLTEQLVIPARRVPHEHHPHAEGSPSESETAAPCTRAPRESGDG